MFDIIKVKNVYTGAAFLPAKHFIGSSPVKALLDFFSFNVSISVYTEKNTMIISCSLNNIQFFEDLKHFGMSKFSDKYFTYIVLDSKDEIMEMDKNIIYPSISYNLTVVVFLNSEKDKKILVNEWCLLKKLTD